VNVIFDCGLCLPAPSGARQAGISDWRRHGRTPDKILPLILATAILAAPLAAEAQSPRLARIGLLCTEYCQPLYEKTLEGQAFMERLRELGYVLGRNLSIEFRDGRGEYARMVSHAAELVRKKIDLILAADSLAAAQAAITATRTIPMVMVGVPDAVDFGLVGSLRHPGGNVTGLTLPFGELAAKQLELLKEILPGMSRAAALSHPSNPHHRPALKGLDAAARALGVEIHSIEAQDLRDLPGAFSAMSEQRVAALLVLPDRTLVSGKLKMLAINGRLPAISLRRDFAVGGGLIAYGPSFPEMYHRAGTYVDKILKGAKPADLPVEEPTKFELVINVTTAKALGLTIPPSVMIRANEVIQ
jgi:putative ABC transport system substrate-binding protein